jgi:hypothetical protein
MRLLPFHTALYPVILYEVHLNATNPLAAGYYILGLEMREMKKYFYGCKLQAIN